MTMVCMTLYIAQNSLECALFNLSLICVMHQYFYLLLLIKNKYIFLSVTALLLKVLPAM